VQNGRLYANVWEYTISPAPWRFDTELMSCPQKECNRNTAGLCNGWEEGSRLATPAIAEMPALEKQEKEFQE
jgi:hypothetical protein